MQPLRLRATSGIIDFILARKILGPVALDPASLTVMGVSALAIPRIAEFPKGASIWMLNLSRSTRCSVSGSCQRIAPRVRWISTLPDRLTAAREPSLPGTRSRTRPPASEMERRIWIVLPLRS